MDLDWTRVAQRSPDVPYIEVVYDEDLGCIAQMTCPDGTVVTAADDFRPTTFP